MGSAIIFNYNPLGENGFNAYYGTPEAYSEMTYRVQIPLDDYGNYAEVTAAHGYASSAELLAALKRPLA